MMFIGDCVVIDSNKLVAMLEKDGIAQLIKLGQLIEGAEDLQVFVTNIKVNRPNPICYHSKPGTITIEDGRGTTIVVQVERLTWAIT